MKLCEIMRGKTKNQFDLTLDSDTYISEIKEADLNYSHNEVVGVVNHKQEILGEVSLEKIRFILENYRKWNMSMILDSIEEGVVALDNTGRIFYTNKMYSKIVGVSRSKVVGKLMQEIESDASIIEVLRTGKPIFKNNQKIKSVDKYVTVKIFPFHVDGKIAGAFSIFSDITEIQNLNQEVTRINSVVDEYTRQNKAHRELKKMNVVGEHPRYLELISKAVVVAPTDVSVLIRGDNGVGKEIFADLIQKNSLRKDKPFIRVNCAAIPENLIESELFGYEEGAFTGASKQGRVGKFKLADGGTLFLDEIGDMPLVLQPKLLRALQEGEIEPIGAEKSLKVDVRIIAATNQPLEKMIEEKTFRQDLYYRLNAITFFVPALHERGNDVILLTNFFLNKFNEEYQKDLVIERAVYDLFLRYPWPGNVRELINCLKFSVLLCVGDMITTNDLPPNIREYSSGKGNLHTEARGFSEVTSGNLKERTRIFERQIISEMMVLHQGDKDEVAQALGISRRTLYRKMEEYKL